MKVFFLLLLLVQLSLQQEWIESPLFQSVLDFSVASNEQRTVLAFANSTGVYYSLSPFDEAILISSSSMNKTHLALEVSNGTWILAFYNRNQANIYRMTDQEFGTWRMVYNTPSLEVEPAVASNGTGVWYLIYADMTGSMRSAHSIDDGKGWPVQTASRYSNFTSSSLSNNLLLAFSSNDTEILYRISDKIVLLNVSGSGRPQVASNNETVVFLSGSGDLYVSNDKGTNWSAPIRLVPGTLTFDDGIWLLLTTNGTLFRSVDETNWTAETIIHGQIDKIDGTSSQFFFLQNETIFRTALFEIILLNESLVVSTPLLLNRSLIVQGNLSVGSSLQIEGDLTLLKNTTLDLSNRNSTIEITGTFTAGGRLVLPEGTGSIVLIRFNSSRGNFSQIVAPRCSDLKYSQNSLIVIFGSSCAKPTIQLWMIIVIVVASVIAVTIAIILFVFFRKKIAPYYNRKYHVSSKNQQA